MEFIIKNGNKLSCDIDSWKFSENDYLLAVDDYQVSEKLLRENFGKIYSHREIVFSMAHYFLIGGKTFSSGCQYCGGHYNLGGLLENWHTTDDLIIPNYNNKGRHFVVNIKGSSSSGRYAALLWSESNNKLVQIKTIDGDEFLPNGMGYYLGKLLNICNKYPNTINKNHLAATQLLNEIDEAEKNTISNSKN
jgi:hypothetical protein